MENDRKLEKSSWNLVKVQKLHVGPVIKIVTHPTKKIYSKLQNGILIHFFPGLANFVFILRFGHFGPIVRHDAFVR